MLTQAQKWSLLNSNACKRFPFGNTGRWVVTDHRLYLNKPLVCLNLKLAWVKPQPSYSIRLKSHNMMRSHVDETQPIPHVCALIIKQFIIVSSLQDEIQISFILTFSSNKTPVWISEWKIKDDKLKHLGLYKTVCTICTYNKIIRFIKYSYLSVWMEYAIYTHIHRIIIMNVWIFSIN